VYVLYGSTGALLYPTLGAAGHCVARRAVTVLLSGIVYVCTVSALNWTLAKAN